MKHPKIFILSALFQLAALSIMFTTSMASPKYGEAQSCTNGAQDDLYDFRGQSTFVKLSPGDTSRIKIILYSNNDVRIALCNEALQKGASIRVIRAVREYNRSIDRIEIRTEDQPVYKLNRAGQKIEMKENGKPKLNAYGEKMYEIEKYIKTERADTVWKTDRNIREETIFDSRKAGGKLFFDKSIDKTMSVIIEVSMPENGKQDAKSMDEWVGVMVGRKFRAVNR